MENIRKMRGGYLFKLLNDNLLRTYVNFDNIDDFPPFYTPFMSMIRASNSSLGTKDLFLIRVL
jgi:hypothetical protein